MFLNKPIGKVNDNYARSIFLKDSCDGSGLNTSDNSKVQGDFLSDIVQLSYVYDDKNKDDKGKKGSKSTSSIGPINCEL